MNITHLRVDMLVNYATITTLDANTLHRLPLFQTKVLRHRYRLTLSLKFLDIWLRTVRMFFLVFLCLTLSTSMIRRLTTLSISWLFPLSRQIVNLSIDYQLWVFNYQFYKIPCLWQFLIHCISHRPICCQLIIDARIQQPEQQPGKHNTSFIASNPCGLVSHKPLEEWITQYYNSENRTSIAKKYKQF